MNSPQKSVQFHLGVDRVFEDHLVQLATLLSRKKGCATVSDEQFKRRFRDPINTGNPLELQGYVEEEFHMEKSIFISRPRFLFNGSLLNNGQSSAAYKIGVAQEVFANFSVTFHLCLTDHLTYCFDHGVLPSGECSWVPLINQMRQQLQPGNSLCVWDTEEITSFKLDVATYWAEASGVVLETQIQLALNNDVTEEMQEKENYARSNSWDIEALDLAYENDLVYLDSGLRLGSSGALFSG